MRKLAAIVILSFALSGCATFGGGGTVTDKWAQIVLQVQQGAVAVCAFEPAAQTVIAIFELANPALATVSSVVSAICASVNAPRATRKGVPRPPTVGGVVVEGRFVR